MSYISLEQEVWNQAPQAVDSNFLVTTSFHENGEPVAFLTAGKTANLVVEVNARALAEYAMIEVPVPAGCTFGNKEYDSGMEYREYRKEKALLFVPLLQKGTTRFEIALEARYAGNYVLNPAKVALMYYPVFFGRTSIKQVTIR
jgi:uncharacterized protein YfaS (alpha-2-macroglobulin family)